MKKKVFALFLVGMMLLSLVACSVAGTEGGSNTNLGSQSMFGTSDGGVTDGSWSDSDGTSSATTDTAGSATTDSTTDKTSSVSSQNPSTSTTSQNSSTATSTNTNTSSSTSSKNTASSTSSKNTSTSTSSGSTATTPDAPLYDATIEHKVILTDNTNGKIVILDMNKVNKDWVKLDWKTSSNSSVCVWSSNSIRDFCGVKYRELPTGEKYVLATSSSGYAYIIDYKTKQTVATLTNYLSSPKKDGALYNAHSIEMLPNGDVIVACSGYQVDNTSYNYQNGGLRYFKRKKSGSTVSYEYKGYLTVPFAHAALWDPSANCLWTIGFEGIVAVDINTSSCTMTKNTAKSLKRSSFTGHDMVPAFGMDGCFWVSDNSYVYLFDSATKTLKRNTTYSASGVKGMAYFEDGTMVTSNWSKKLTVYVNNPYDNNKGYKIAETEVAIKGSGTYYKIHTCTAKYE